MKETQSPRLGPSQRSVLRYIEENRTSCFTAQEVGNSIYPRESAATAEVRRAWATRILASLFRKGLIDSGWDGNKAVYFSLKSSPVVERGLALRTPGTARRWPPRREPTARKA